MFGQKLSGARHLYIFGLGLQTRSALSPARVERWPSAGTRAVAKALEVGNEMQKERNLSHGCASLYI